MSPNIVPQDILYFILSIDGNFMLVCCFIEHRINVIYQHTKEDFLILLFGVKIYCLFCQFSTRDIINFVNIFKPTLLNVFPLKKYTLLGLIKLHCNRLLH
jgi:hypothetical protein